MTEKAVPANATGELRVRAETLLAAEGTDLRSMPPAEVLELVHELQVHQIELEMQNEELLRAQETIAASRDRYADLYDFAPVGYVTLDPEGLIVEVNLAGATLLGGARDSILRTPFLLFLTPGDRQAFRGYLRQLPADGAIQSCELVLIPQKGPAVAVSLEGLAIVDAGGKVTRYRITIADITRRRDAEADLRHSEEKFRLLFEKAPLGYQSLDENGIIREVNQTWLGILGYSREEVIGRWFGDFLAPGHFDRFPDDFARFKDTGEVSNADFEMQRKDKAPISVSFNRRAAFDDQGRFVRTHCIFQDITARKQAEAEIVRKSNQLRALAARLGEVEEAQRLHLARELHDQVCQSLTALGLTLTLLQAQMPKTSPGEILHRIAHAVALVEQTGETIRDLMAELRPPMLDDYGLLSSLHWYGAEFSRRTGIGVDIQGQEAAPRLAAPVELSLFRIVQEALANVAGHARASRVELSEAEDNGMVRLVISDNGVGFDQDQLGQPEGRLRWGIMTMSERAAAAGGRCRVESQPGQGTRVVVEVNR